VGEVDGSDAVEVNGSDVSPKHDVVSAFQTRGTQPDESFGSRWNKVQNVVAAAKHLSTAGKVRERQEQQSRLEGVGSAFSGQKAPDLAPLELWLAEARVVLNRVEREAGIEGSEDQAQRDQIVHPILAPLREGISGGVLGLLRKLRRNDIVGEIEALEQVTLKPGIPLGEAAVRWETVAHVVAAAGSDEASEAVTD